MSLYRDALKMQAFNKDTNNLFGYVIKRILSSPDNSALTREPWTAIENMLNKDEYYVALKQACQLWKHVLFIQQIINAEVQVSNLLSDQFKKANDFLVKRMRAMGEKEIADLLEKDN